MRITLLQLPARWNEVAASLALVDQLLSAAPAGELVLLPEASLTGYVSPRGDFDLARFAEPPDGPTAQALAALARKHRCALVGPLIERNGDQLFNTLIGFDRSGNQILSYRKRHPWYPEQWATAGEDEYPTISLADRTVTCAICFDLHFLADEVPRAELLLFASAWVDDEGDARTPALQALARQAGMAIANANWGEGEPRLPGQGASMAIDKQGNILVRAGAGLERLDADL